MGQKGSKASKRQSLIPSQRSSVDKSSDEHDGASPPLTADGQKKKKPSKKMPLFRRQSEKAKRRLDHLEYLSQENPEPIFDVSNCELEEVPSKVFALCKVLQKEVLLLHDNWLHSLMPSQANVTDLLSIRVLDLHNNELKTIPEQIGELVNLQVLNLENNKLTKLPDRIGELKCLQTLNVKVNKLKSLPSTICTLQSLRMLDISNNHVTSIPKQLCKVRTLETLVLDAESMVYPPKDLCSSGTEEIMKVLCSECGLEYLPPSNFLLNVLDPPKFLPSSPTSKAFEHEETLMKSIDGYNSMMDKKRQERVELERTFAEHQEEQAQLALIAQANREQTLQTVADAESKMEEDFERLFQAQELSRQRLVKDVQAVEQNADALIQVLLDMNEKAKKNEELLEAIEEERIKENKLFEVRWEDIQNLRRKEILGNMERILQESEWFEVVRQNFTNDKENVLQRALEDDENMATAQVASVLEDNDKQMVVLLSDLAKQEELQKEAFEALQLQKDSKHQRIANQIALIQDELATLTVVEIERREFRKEEEINRLAEKRIALIELLSTLMFEQDCRQAELKKRLAEMEQQRQDGQTDYWLVQYQRLMDQKPQALIDRERELEICVVKILQRSHAEDYLPVFARHRISIETLLQMDEDDLKQMGVHELGTRKDIMRNIQLYKSEEGARASKATAKVEPEFSLPAPSAPPHEDISPKRQLSMVARGLNSECSICLDEISNILFMNCGHVCCCQVCSASVELCPLCRADIVRKIVLS